MNEFKPKYRIRIWIAILFFPPSLAFLGPQIFENPAKNPNLTISWFCILIMTSFLPMILIRRIKFEDHRFIVENYIGATKKISYGDVIHVGSALVKYRGGKVSLHSITNVDDLVNLLSDRIDLYKMEG